LVLGAAIALGAAGLYGHAVADHTEQSAAQKPLKALTHPFADTLIGSWTTESTGTMDGKTAKGTGKVTYARGIGDTALIQVYETTMPGPDGKPLTFHGLGVHRVSDDGKTMTIHWSCNMWPDAIQLSGPLTDTRVELSGQSPHGERMTISFQKTGDTLTA
jgi:hypothetical protein